MIKKVLFKGITFNNIKKTDFDRIIKKKGLFVFPSGPGLASIYSSSKYHNSLKRADLVLLDWFKPQAPEVILTMSAGRIAYLNTDIIRN